MKQIDTINTVEPLLVEVLSIQNPSANEITKWLAIDKVKSLLPKRFFIEEDSYGNLLFDNRPVKKRTEPVPTIIAHLDQVHYYARGFRLALFGDKLVAYDDIGRRVGTGGDDKCGIYVLIKLLLSDIPCRAIVTQDEEIGLLGTAEIKPAWGEQSSILLQADRRGCNDLIKHTNGNLIASDDLVARVLALPECADMKPEYGSVTDVGDLCSLFEVAGFNISAGYYDAHSSRESIKLSELQLCLARVMAICRMVGNEVQSYPDQPMSRYGGRYGYSFGAGSSATRGRGLDIWDDFDDDMIIAGMCYVTKGGITIGPMQQITHNKYVVAALDSSDIAMFVEANYGCDYTPAVWNEWGECDAYPDLDVLVDVDGSLITPDCTDDTVKDSTVADGHPEVPLPDWAAPLPTAPKGYRWAYVGGYVVNLPHPYLFSIAGREWVKSSKGESSSGGALLYAKAVPLEDVNAGLTLQEGKYYETRDGEEVGPLKKTSNIHYPFTYLHSSWTEDGTSVIGKTYPRDLVKEIVK